MATELISPRTDRPVGLETGSLREGIPWLVLGSLAAALALLAGAIALTQAEFRNELRAQLAHRDALGLAALVQKQLALQTEAEGSSPIPALLETLIVPELPGIWDLTLFDTNRLPLVALLHDPRVTPPTPGQFEQLAKVAAAANATTAIDDESTVPPVAAEFRDGPAGPQLVVLMALTLTGSESGIPSPPVIAAFALDGVGLASEFVRLDHNLRRRSWFVFGLLGAVMLGALGFTFRQLILTQRQLRQQTARLEATNRELTLAAKTSAVGSVTAHLVHGLKNPLAALQHFVGSSTNSPNATIDRADAAETARRMKAMIDDVVRVLHDEHSLTAFELSPSELIEHVVKRCSGPAHALGVRIFHSASDEARLANRVANLVALILENLITNAIQAVPAGGEVQLSARAHPKGICFSVCDSGPGLPDSVRARLFRPGLTTKAGGTGLGLALSHQLARHCDGELSLVQTGPTGTTFALTVPAKPIAD